MAASSRPTALCVNETTPRASSAQSEPQVSGVSYGELTESIGFLLRRSLLTATSHLIGALAPIDLRPVQFTILALIDANPNLAQSELCDELRIQRPNFGKILDELEARGLTKRLISPLDRRVKTLALTSKGKKLFGVALKIHSGHEARLVKQVGAGGRAQLEVMLRRIAAGG